MSEDSLDGGEVFVIPTIGEYLTSEIRLAEEGVDVHGCNLDAINVGDDFVLKIYHSRDAAEKALNEATLALVQLKNAQRALENGDSVPAFDIVEAEIHELNKIINENLQHGQPEMAQDAQRRMNMLRAIRT